MKLFKNGVGRPSNDTLRKRRIFYTTLTIAVLTIIGGTAIFTNNYVEKIKGAVNGTTCTMPYSYSNCKSAKNPTVQKIQTILKKLKLYNSSTDGNFGTLTKNAVKSFQKSQKVSQDGSVGPDTLERLAKKGNVKYFKIKFNKNGGSGNLIYSDTLVVLNGVQTPIPSTKLSKSGSNHVGYTITAKSLDGKTTYKYGCYTQNCSTGSRAYTEAQIKSSGKKFYPVVYNIGGTVAETGWLKGQVVTFTAMYCKSGETYDKTKSACVKSSSANTNIKYNISSGDYNMFVAVVCQEDGTGYTGALAVVDAIFNRVDKGYGKNPVAVIKAKGQFSAYGTGAYKKRIKNGAIISSCSGAKKAVDFRLANPTSRTHKFVNFKDKSLKNKYKNGVVYGDNVYHN